MAWIKPERVRRALHSLSEWHKSAPDQGSKHILPLLALLEHGAGRPGTRVEFRETPDEFEFWDRYFRLDGDPKKPYFNALTLRRCEINYPHSNAATIRKKTFDLKWHAGVLDQSAATEHWTLAGDYADIFRNKALTKQGKAFRVPVVDLGVILFRDDDIEPASAAEIVKRFRNRFTMEEADYQKIFQFREEDPAEIFTSVKPTKMKMSEAIASALISEVVQPSAAPPASPMTRIADLDDPVLSQVQEILAIGTSGIILTGAPGTGKTYYARRIAETLVKDPAADIFRVQFHPSFGYEDFIEGYRPDDAKTSGFGIVSKVFIAACERAEKLGAGDYVVFIVDEINRGDPARIFGELLTYLERSYRGLAVTLPFSGKTMIVPKNLLMVGTMNPHDRSVSHIDAAFVRRFDHIEISPSRETLEAMLEETGGGFTTAQIEIIGDWFDKAQQMLPIGLGHAVFADVRNLDTLKTIWRYRIRPTAEALMETNGARREDFGRSYDAMIRRLEGGGASD